MTPHEQQIIDTLCLAIQGKNVVRFWYENVSGRKEWRIVEPYLVGAFPQKHIQLSAWLLPTPEQILAGQQDGWRSYILKKISEVQILEQAFLAARKDYDPKGNGMKQIYCAAASDYSPLRIS